MEWKYTPLNGIHSLGYWEVINNGKVIGIIMDNHNNNSLDSQVIFNGITRTSGSFKYTSNKDERVEDAKSWIIKKHNQYK